MKRLITALFLIAIATVILGCNRDAGLTPPPPVEVIVCNPVKEKIEDWDTYTGTVDAKAPVQIRANPRVQAEIKQVLFTEGEEIEADKLLFLIDDAQFQADLTVAKGQLTTSKADLKKAEETIAIYEPLAKSGTVAKEELVKAVGAKGQALGSVGVASGKIAEAENNIKYCKVQSSVAGKIGLALLTKGNIVNAGGTDSLLATIVPVDPLYVYFNVNQQALLTYQAFMLKKFEKDKQAAGKVEIPVKMSVEGGTTFPFNGVIDFLDNQLDKNTGTVKVRARFDNPKGADGRRKLSPGMFARIRVAIGDAYTPILISDRAILPDQSLKYVLVVNKAKENKVERKDIVVSNRLQPDGLRAVEGLNGDEWVIVEGVNRVRPGVAANPTEGKMPRRPVGK